MSPFASMIIQLAVRIFSDQNGQNNFRFDRHPELGLTMEQIIRRNGYPFEMHHVETEDHYILGLYRIPYGREPDSSKNRSAVLITHGMGGTAEHYTNLGRDHALVYYLADRGFDVWMMCNRGTDRSSKHRYYNWDKDLEYWQFSFHEIGVYDLPASVDYILARNGQSKIFYIGQSSGTTSFFSMTSSRKDYNDKIKIAALYGTSALLANVGMPIIKLFAVVHAQINNLFINLGLGYLPPYQSVLSEVLSHLCSEATVFSEACLQGMNFIGSSESRIIDKKMAALAAASSPTRISLHCVIHYLQLIRSGFKRFDYGPQKNLQIYGETDAPEYNLTNSVAPSFLVWGESDFITAPEDSRLLAKILPNVLRYKVPFKYFNHLDFIFGSNVSALVYEPTVRLFKAYDEGRVPANIGDMKL